MITFSFILSEFKNFSSPYINIKKISLAGFWHYTSGGSRGQLTPSLRHCACVKSLNIVCTLDLYIGKNNLP